MKNKEIKGKKNEGTGGNKNRYNIGESDTLDGAK